MGYADEIKKKQDERKARQTELNVFHNRDLPRPNLIPESKSRKAIGESARGLKPRPITFKEAASALFGVDLTHATRDYRDKHYFSEDRSHKPGRAPIRGMSDAELVKTLLFHNQPHLERTLRFGEPGVWDEDENDPVREAIRRFGKTGDRDLYEAFMQNIPKWDVEPTRKWAERIMNAKNKK